MGGGDAPPPPDYKGAAQEQSASSRESVAAQTWANRPTMNTPWGSQTWQTGTAKDPSTGLPVTTWTGNTTLNPAEQAALDSQHAIQQGRSDAAQTLLGQATGAFNNPFDWGALPHAPGSTEEASNAAYQNMIGRAQPGRDRAQAALETKLATQGFSRGAEGYKNAQTDLADQFTRENMGFQTQAGQEGRADAATQEGLRGQAIQEQIQRRGMSLNELNALLTGQQVAMPNMPSFAPAGGAQATQSLTAAGMQGQANQAGQTDWGSMIGAGAGAIGTVALVAV